MPTTHDVKGYVAQGFEAVEEAFRANLEQGDAGAAFAAYVDGAFVVDIWGGVADPRHGAPWRYDTTQIIFSGTKGLVATCVLMLIDRGELSLDDRVCTHWPEFGQAGKGDVLVVDVLSHRARIPGLEQPVTWREATDARAMADLLAAQRQSSDPRAASTYHALTFGWIAGELVRRIDGRSIGTFFRDEIAMPLNLDLWIGLPPNKQSRVARMELGAEWGSSPTFTAEKLANDPLLRSVFANPPRYEAMNFPWNEREWQAAEVPAANAVGTARAIATFYGSLDRLLSDEVIRLGTTSLNTQWDMLADKPMAFGVGFQLQSAEMPFGAPPDAFGHCGSGGSCHGRWPTERVGFSYATNLMRDDRQDRRARTLLDALQDGLGAMGL